MQSAAGCQGELLVGACSPSGEHLLLPRIAPSATLAVVRVVGYLIRVGTVLTGPPDVVQIAGWLSQIMLVMSTNQCMVLVNLPYIDISVNYLLPN